MYVKFIIQHIIVHNKIKIKVVFIFVVQKDSAGSSKKN